VTIASIFAFGAGESTFRTSPLLQLFRDGPGHKRASVAARATTCQKFVVSCMRMSYMRSNRKLDGACLEVSGCGRTTNPVRVLLARVFSNRLLLLLRTTWKQFADASREPIDVLGVERLTPLGSALSSEFPGCGVRQTFLFCPCERRLFHQHTLALVALPRTTEADHHRAQCRMPAGAPGQGGIPTWQEHEMIQIGTCETQGAFRLQAQKTALAKLVATFGADRVPDDPEDHDLARRRNPLASRSARRR
jgi:hypothetical protein